MSECGTRFMFPADNGYVSMTTDTPTDFSYDEALENQVDNPGIYI